MAQHLVVNRKRWSEKQRKQFIKRFRAKEEREFEKQLPLSDLYDDGLANSLVNWWKNSGLNISFAEYLKLLESLFDRSAFLREAWVCRMFREKKFDQLFQKRPPFGSENARRQSLKFFELHNHLWLATRALLEFGEDFKSKVTQKTRGKLSPAATSFVRQRFQTLTKDDNKHKPLCKNSAYLEIAKELIHPMTGRSLADWKKAEEGITTIRRICDQNFAKQSNCVYEASKQNPETVDPDSIEPNYTEDRGKHSYLREAQDLLDQSVTAASLDN